jgi:hypothetical protein
MVEDGIGTWQKQISGSSTQRFALVLSNRDLIGVKKKHGLYAGACCWGQPSL